MSEYSISPAWRAQSLGRRGFLRVSAASAATVALVATGCSNETPTPTAPDIHQLVLPGGDTGLLYYGYLLAKALFTVYDKVVSAPPVDLSVAERVIFADLRYHQLVYQELFHYYIDAALNPIFPGDLAFSTAGFTLTSRAGVLAAAQQLEDLAAAAQPVLLALLTTGPATVTKRLVLAKMVSVQARHAATVRDLRTPGSFADATVVDANGQLLTKTPTEVNAALAPGYLPYVINVANLALPL